MITDEADFSPSIKRNITNLVEQGADIVVCTCNTAHIYFDRWGKDHGAMVLNIIDVTVDELQKLSGVRVGVFAGLALRNSGVYERAITVAGLGVVDLEDDESQTIWSAILSVKKHGKIGSSILEKIDRIFHRLKSCGTDCLVLGCTELTPLIPLASRYFKNVVDSNLSLAKAAISASQNFQNAE